MNLTVPVAPPPPPVLPFKIEIEYKYVVIRGNGDNKVFPSLYGGGGSSWNQRGNYPDVNLTETILIPIDMLTAVSLGMVTFSELELPDHFKAFVNMIKP